MRKRILLILALAAAANAGTVLYDSIPGPLPPNLPSIGYQATGTSEFGNLVTLSSGPSVLTSATVIMSNWALESTYETVGKSAGFSVDLTLNFYNAGTGNSVGSLIDSVSAPGVFISWRPEANPACGAGSTKWVGSDGNCYNGHAQAVTIALPQLDVPGTFIYGLAYNTQTYGSDPFGVEGPYNSLNFALNSSQPSVGSNPVPDTLYMNSNYYGAPGAFQPKGDWSPYDPAIQFSGDSVPEPSTWGLLAAGLVALGLKRRRS